MTPNVLVNGGPARTTAAAHDSGPSVRPNVRHCGRLLSGLRVYVGNLLDCPGKLSEMVGIGLAECAANGNELAVERPPFCQCAFVPNYILPSLVWPIIEF